MASATFPVAGSAGDAAAPRTGAAPGPGAVNIAADRCVGLDDGPGLRAQLMARCRTLGLKGSIRLAPEGMNLFLAGAPQAIAAVLAALRLDARLADLQVKTSLSAAPLARLKDWLDAGCDDEGRPVVMLDTRHAFERERGGFDGRVDFGIARFSDVAPAVDSRAARFAGQTVVTCCTGGIRGEKAALLLRGAGIGHVFPLDGGIRDGFERVGGTHGRGDGLVFDARTALDPRPCAGTTTPGSAAGRRTAALGAACRHRPAGIRAAPTFGLNPRIAPTLTGAPCPKPASSPSTRLCGTTPAASG